MKTVKQAIADTRPIIHREHWTPRRPITHAARCGVRDAAGWITLEEDVRHDHAKASVGSDLDGLSSVALKEGPPPED